MRASILEESDDYASITEGNNSRKKRQGQADPILFSKFSRCGCKTSKGATSVPLGAQNVNKFPETRISLILRLGASADVQAWQEFAEVYAPALHRLALRKGLQPSDADDVTQEILFGVARAIERFEPDDSRASFRTWLSRIARNLIADFCRNRARRPAFQADSAIWEDEAVFATEGDDPLDAEFEAEYQISLFQLAARNVRSRINEQTWLAFEMTSIDGSAAAKVANDLNMSVGAVYVVRCRVLKMLRQEVKRLEARQDLMQAKNSMSDSRGI